MRLLSTPILAIATLAISASVNAQSTAVPRLIRYNGSYQKASAAQQTLPQVIGATFSIYRDQYDGAPLWSEVQNIRPDKDGNYTAMLGSTQAEGMPVDLFMTTEPRWLEVELDQIKQPRVLLGSVPYALKAADADTLGGLPATAYLRANPSGAASTNSTTNNVSAIMAPGLLPLASSGTPSCVGMFAANGTDGTNSIIDQTTYAGNPAVTVGTPCVPGGAAGLGALTLIGNVPFGDAAGMAVYNAGGGGGASVSLDMYNTSFNGGIPQAKIKAVDDGNYSDHLTFWTKTPGGPGNPVTERVRITSSGNVGIGTSSPSQKLDVAGIGRFTGGIMFGDGTTQMTAASGGGGGVTAVIPGTDLTGGGTGGVVTLNLDTTKVPQLNTANAFVGNQSIAGTLSVTGSLSAASLLLRGTGVIQVDQGNGAVPILQFPATGYNFGAGPGALNPNSTGTHNTASGSASLSSDTTGSLNTANGQGALFLNTTGGNNTANGYFALVNNIGGNFNTANGSQALNSNTTGSSNTANGQAALYSNTAGGNNIAVGFLAGYNPTAGSYNIMVGNQGLAADDHTIRIGDVQTQTFIAGISGVNVSGVPVLVSSSGQLGVASSSRRFKQDIEDMGESTSNLMRLRPVTYRYKQPFDDGSQPLQYGLIAEEVEEVYPELVARSADGKIETVKYQVLDSMLLNEVQKLHAQNAAQQEQNTAQQERIHSLEERLSRLESLLEQNSAR